MRIYLLAPFRTQFQLHTEYCLSNWDTACETVGRGLKQIDLPHEMTAAGPVRTEPVGFQKYDSLNSDHLGPFVQPVVTLTVPQSQFAGLCERYFADVARQVGAPLDRIILKSLQIFVHDNTIAMAQFELEVPASSVTPELFVEHFDLATTHAGRAFVAEVAGPTVGRIAQHFAAATLSGRSAGKMLVPPQRFVAFDDVEFSRHYGWPADKSAMLWVNRTMIIGRDEEAFHPSATAWGRLNGESKHALEQDRFISIRPGNNLFLNEDDSVHFLPALRVIQYFYIIFDTFSDRLKRFYVNIGPWRDERSVTEMHRKATRISSFFSFVRTEFSDLRLGIQSERKDYAERLINAFGMEQLIDNVGDKHLAVDAKIAALLEIRGQRRQKVLQIGIILIGALQIFDLLMNISWFALTEPQIVNDGVPGIFSLGLNVSPNLLQNLAFLVVLAAAVLLTNRRRL